MALKRTAAPMSGLVHTAAAYTWSSLYQGNLGLYQLRPRVVEFKEGVASAATVLYISQDEARELGRILARFGATGILD